jgi:hypothetical protein
VINVPVKKCALPYGLILTSKCIGGILKLINIDQKSHLEPLKKSGAGWDFFVLFKKMFLNVHKMKGGL